MISLLVGAAMAVSPVAYAASGPLAPGAAAGVKKAEMFSSASTLVWVLGAAVVVGGVALVVSNGSNGHPGTVSTCAPGQTSCSSSSSGT
jgi:hypothetical protein